MNLFISFPRSCVGTIEKLTHLFLKRTQKTSGLNRTLADVLDNLKAISYIVYDIKDIDIKQLPSKLSEKQHSILKALDIKPPKTL